MNDGEVSPQNLSGGLHGSEMTWQSGQVMVNPGDAGRFLPFSDHSYLSVPN